MVSEAQAVALMDNLINGLVRERVPAAALQLKLGFVLGLRLLFGLGLGLSFQLHSRDVPATGLPFGWLWDMSGLKGGVPAAGGADR